MPFPVPPVSIMFLLCLRLLLAGGVRSALGLAEAIKCGYIAVFFHKCGKHFCVFLKEAREEALISAQGLIGEGMGNFIDAPCGRSMCVTVF